MQLNLLVLSGNNESYTLWYKTDLTSKNMARDSIYTLTLTLSLYKENMIYTCKYFQYFMIEIEAVVMEAGKLF